MADHGAARPPPDNPPAGGTAASAEGWVREQADLCRSVQMTLLNCLCVAIPARERVVTWEEGFELSIRSSAVRDTRTSCTPSPGRSESLERADHPLLRDSVRAWVDPQAVPAHDAAVGESRFAGATDCATQLPFEHRVAAALALAERRWAVRARVRDPRHTSENQAGSRLPAEFASVHAAFVAAVVEHMHKITEFDCAIQLGQAVTVRMGAQLQVEHLQACQRCAVRLTALSALAIWRPELTFDVLRDRLKADGAAEHGAGLEVITSVSHGLMRSRGTV
jgi:hypothetical protein